MTPDTYFAPPERAEAVTIQKQHEALSAARGLSEFASAVPDFVVVLNRQRQVVYANQALVQFMRADSARQLCGHRPGELFHCIHSAEMRYGCGTSASCRLCGAVLAVLETQSTNAPSTRDCTIVAHDQGRKRTYDFRIMTTPFLIADEPLVLVSLTDTGAQKRKGALEWVFFHDILNTASSLKVYIELIKRNSPGLECRRFVDDLDSIADSLIDEIRSQKMLVAAENGTLEVQKHLIDSRELVEQIVRLFLHHELAEGKRIEIAPFSESLAFIADETILRRVLANGVKNALEAARQDSTVTVGFRRSEDRVRFFVHNDNVIDQSMRGHIFSRYHSTKGTGRGLGTYSMKLLTEGYLDGEVSFESSEEAGTTFTVIIPM